MLQPDEIAYILNNSQASCVVTSAALLPRIAAVRDRLPALRTVVVVGESDALPAALTWDEFLADAIENERKHVRMPARDALFPMIVEAPRRITEWLLAGVKP